MMEIPRYSPFFIYSNGLSSRQDLIDARARHGELIQRRRYIKYHMTVDK